MAVQQQGTSESAPRRSDWEWFWRFLAVVMAISVAWVIWIASQIGPRPLATPAAYEAAAQAKSRSAKGRISPAPAPAPEPAPAPSMPQNVPPVDMEKLRMSDTLTAPVASPPAAK